MGKVFLYLFIIPIIIWALDCLRLDILFKKHKELQIKVFYILLALGLAYLVVNCLYDFSYYFGTLV